jgi:very-short-patch-repair endonuclease
MNPYIELLKSEFREICAAFYIAQIDDYFSEAGFVNLNQKYNHRREEVDAYYELIDWENPSEIRKFIKVIENVLVHKALNVGDGTKETLRNICRKCGIEVDNNGYTLYLTKQSTNESIKNIIFASNHLKPEIILSDSLINQIQIVENAEFCLIYDRPIKGHGLLWMELVDWWKYFANIKNLSDTEAGKRLYKRLKESLKDNQIEIFFFENYYQKLYPRFSKQLPALIPQVYLHYDPYTIQLLKKMSKNKRLKRQRMDFLLLLPRNQRIVIEIDGKQHYSDNQGRANPNQYSEMVAEDRKLKLSGYEIYRFGGYELMQDNASIVIEDFFLKLFSKYEIFQEF